MFEVVYRDGESGGFFQDFEDASARLKPGERIIEVGSSLFKVLKEWECLEDGRVVELWGYGDV